MKNNLQALKHILTALSELKKAQQLIADENNLLLRAKRKVKFLALNIVNNLK